MSRYRRGNAGFSRRRGRVTYTGFKAHSRGLTLDEVAELPTLRPDFQAACAPLAVLFDEAWADEPDVRRQMVGLCLRCPFRDTCPERKT